jgi:hypothetical protein
MKQWKCWMAALALLAPSVALAHGGGFVMIPIYIPGGAAPGPARAITGDYSSFKRVAIVTGIGETVTLGDTALFDQYSTLDVRDWKIDDQVNATLRRYLASRFTFVDIPYDRAALAAIPNGLMDNTKGRLHDYLLGLRRDDIDAFIVVRPDAEGSGPTTPGLSLADAGIVRPVFRANYEIDIVDARSLVIVGHAFARIAPRLNGGVSFVQILGAEGLKVKPGDKPSDSQREGMRAEFTHIVNESLIETLRSLNTGVPLPEPGARVLVPIPADKYPFHNIKNVGIVSAIGDSLMMEHRGAWFAHDTDHVAVADWKLDDAVEHMVAAELDKRFTVKPVVADRAKLSALDMKFTDAALTTPMDGLTPSSDVDAYIVVLKHNSFMGPIFSGVAGPGVWHSTPVGSDSTSIFVNYSMALVDAKTLKTIWIVWGVTSPDHATRYVVEDADGSLWADKGALSPDQLAKIHPVVLDELADSVPETMMRMALTGKMLSDEPPPAPTPMGAGQPSDTPHP